MIREICIGRRFFCFILLLTVTLWLPAAVSADAPANGRFVDHNNGTVTDTLTGLIWLRHANAFGQQTWDDAAAACAALAATDFDWLDDGSTAGDWRLPDAYEMLSLTGAGPVGANLTDKHPFIDFPGRGRGVVYWTASAGFYDTTRAWRIHTRGNGGVSFEEKSKTKLVWAVRGRSQQAPAHAGTVPDLADTFDRLTEREQQRAELNALWDFTGLRLKDTFVVMNTEAFLTPPPALADQYPSAGYRVAKTAPTVKMQILPNLEPEYFPEGEAYAAGWANWAKVTRSDDNRFFMAASDHRARDAKINLYEYRPDEGEHGVLKRALDISQALGWHENMYTDGKVHGHMGIMPDGTLWAATHRGPAPTDAWWQEGYRGAWLFSYNIHTGEATNWGVPLIGQELPSHVLDPERGIFLATGHLNTTMLSWDVNEKRVRFAGSPPNGWRWHARSMFLDPETGYFWGVDRSEEPYRFLSFDPELNRFKRHEVEVPENPETGSVALNRLHTNPKAADGWYYNVLGSTLFRFRPDWDEGPEIEVIGVTHGNTVQTALCPAKRYVYWIPRRDDTMMVMQYDTRTGEKKALGFLKDHILENYGYDCGSGVFGMNISDCGAFLVVLDNGGFGRRFGGHPALFVIYIPESERVVD